MKKKILIVIKYFTPGFKAGGPILSIQNLIDWIQKTNKKDFEFFIVCKDRDINDSEKYNNIYSYYNKNEGINIQYIAPHKLFFEYRAILKQVSPDIIYFNSFFSFEYGIFPIIFSKYFRRKKMSMLIAPRGQLSLGALGIKSKKKLFALIILRTILNSKNIYWHATNNLERIEITDNLHTNAKVYIANNLPRLIPHDINKDKNLKLSKRLKIIYLSRITPKKNLLYVIKTLNNLSIHIDFDIYGVIDDESYWKKCQSHIKKLPENIIVKYKGIVKTKDVPKTILGYDLFFLPTQGENFGHSIIEALFSYCPVLISDLTPWRDVERKKAGWAIPLSDNKKYIQVINYLYNMNQDDYLRYSTSARIYAENKINSIKIANSYAEIFKSI